MTHDELNVTNNYRYLQNFKHLWGLVTFSSGLLMNAGHSLSAGLHLGITTHVCVCVCVGGGGGGGEVSAKAVSSKAGRWKSCDKVTHFPYTSSPDPSPTVLLSLRSHSLSLMHVLSWATLLLGYALWGAKCILII